MTIKHNIKQKQKKNRKEKKKMKGRNEIQREQICVGSVSVWEV